MSKTTIQQSTSTTRQNLFTIRISDDENIGTTLTTIPGAKELKCNLTNIIKINPNTGRIYTIGVPSAKNMTSGKYVCKLAFNDGREDGILVVYVYDGCYNSPCGNNPCIDTFKSYVCKCLNGQCDENSNLEAAKTSDSASDVSKGALIGIVVGVLALVAIILVLIAIVFKKPNNKTFAEKYEEEMMTNPIFVSPTNRSIIVTNSAYEYLNHHPNHVDLVNNPMYAFNNNHSTISLDNPMYDFNNDMYEHAPELPLKICQKDMVRSLANENTSELYCNVADAKNIVVHDLTI